jgi:AbrB family looped-hinge helix DNA binding protein
MQAVATTKMSSKGQVVIPEEIRRSLSLEAGTQFIVLGDDGVVVLKTISPPSVKEFDSIIRRARAQAKAAGMVPKDIAKAIKESRQSK